MTIDNWAERFGIQYQKSTGQFPVQETASAADYSADNLLRQQIILFEVPGFSLYHQCKLILR